jgi:hypothetical protein
VKAKLANALYRAFVLFAYVAAYAAVTPFIFGGSLSWFWLIASVVSVVIGRGSLYVLRGI